MITAAVLRDRRIAAKHTDDPDLVEAERLKARLARARDKRVPFYLSRDEFLAVCRWKLGDQYGRAARLLESSSEKRVKRTTQMAFCCKDKEVEFELAGRVTILRLLPGVGIGVASAILALCYPKRYAPLDARVWPALFDEQRSTFELADYRRYLTRLSELAAEVRAIDRKGSWSVQLVGYFAGGDDEERSASRPDQA
jgi:hypothetical protein